MKGDRPEELIRRTSSALIYEKADDWPVLTIDQTKKMESCILLCEYSLLSWFQTYVMFYIDQCDSAAYHDHHKPNKSHMVKLSAIASPSSRRSNPI